MNTQYNLSLLSAGIALSFSAQTLAQTSDSDSVKGVERIEVTAQKRVTTLQETPIAITAFNADAIENYDIESISDVGGLAPNLEVFQPIGSTFNVGATLRGLGTAEPSLAIDPKVGIYLDGVYLARNSGAVFKIVDLERVEVLRGPQGTLWGKNTTGGALNLVTKKPAEEFGVRQTFTMGNDNLFESITAINFGAIGDLTGSFTYVNSEYDGWATNTYAEAKYKNLGSEDTKAYRLALRYTGDNVTVDYSYDKTDAESVPMPSQISNVRSFFTDPTVPTLNLATNQLYAGNVFSMMAANEHSAKRQTEYELDFHGPEEVEISGQNLTIEWQISDTLTLKSITSKREYTSDINEGTDFDGGAYFAPALNFTPEPTVDPSNTIAIPAFHITTNKVHEQTSQEIQLLGSMNDGKVNYVAGYYDFSEEGETINPWSLGIFTGQGANLLFTDPLNYGGFDFVTADSEAVYANVDVAINDQLNVIAGLRHTKDDKSLTQQAELDAMLREDLYAEKDWSKTVGSLTVNYVPNRDLTVYGSISQGYASGNFNPGAIDRFAFLDPANMGLANYDGSLIPSDPEDTTAYELGFKTVLLDNRLMLNTAVFLNDSTNLQRTEIRDRIRYSVNTGESENMGIEIDAQFAVTDALTLSGSFGYQDIEYSDDTFTDQTRHNASLGMLWDIAELGWSDLSLHVDYKIVDDKQFSVSDPSLVADAYNLLNARLMLSNINFGNDNSMKVSLWGKNITDETYIVHGANFSFFDAQTYGAPASYGLDVRFEF